MTYLQQYGQPPTAAQVRGLIDRQIREEIYLREGLALKLDQGDEIVRRRIVQKYEFLQTDLSVVGSPGPDALRRWFQQNISRYLIPERVAFSQVYFSTDRNGAPAAKGRAARALEKLRATHASRAAGLGDPFPGPSDIGALAPDEVVRLFGESELSGHLFKLPLGQWSGPYASGYGWHLIYVTGHLPAELLPFARIQDRVFADYQDEQRRLTNARHFAKLRAKYTIQYDGADPAVMFAKANVRPGPAGE